MERFLTPNWVSSRWFIGIVSATLGFVASSGFDQAIRNRVDERMYGYWLRELLPNSIEDYQAIPIHWRQVISELSIRKQVLSDAESKQLSATLEHFDANQLRLVDKIAPYVVADFLIRDPKRSDIQHPIPNVVYADLLDLESLGVLQSVAHGTTIRRDITSSKYVLHTDSLTFTVKPGQTSGILQFSTTRITAPWQKIIALLRVPTDPTYIKWFVSNMRSGGFHVLGAHYLSAKLVHYLSGFMLRDLGVHNEADRIFR